MKSVAIKLACRSVIQQRYGRCARRMVCVGASALVAAAMTTSVSAQDSESSDDLLDLDLDALVNIEVTSVSKKAQKMTDAAAAIAVVTGEDVRKSGATSIPDALRLVPGLQVAQVNSGSFAISARGFNNQFANKLLVMIDGRSVYTPLFSGVYWDAQNVMLDDLDRIEVIRGPGATVWGANAVNGVINITTKSARDTQGALLYGGGGTLHEIMAGGRYGGQVGENETFYRVYGMYKQEGDLKTAAGASGNDNWNLAQGGFRVDHHADDSSQLTWQGDVYGGDVMDDVGEISGFNTLGRWGRSLSETSSVEAQLYYDRTQREDDLLDNDRDTIDFSAQHTFALGERNDLIWGVGYRYSRSESAAVNPLAVSINDSTLTTHLYSAFIQDDFKLIPEKLTLTVGSKFEHNDFTGFEVQPSGRLAYKPAENQTIWGSVARAVRTPSDVEGFDGLRLAVGGPAFVGQPPAPAPGLYVPVLFGNPDAEAEILMAYEIGYRIQPTQRLSFDLAAFYNDYDDLLTLQPTGVYVPGAPVGTDMQTFRNLAHGKTYGGEFAANWFPTDTLQVSGSYSLLFSDITGPTPAVAAYGDGVDDSAPTHQASLRATQQITEDVDVTGQLRYVDNVASHPSYLEGDLRVAWRPIEDLELSLVGQNLFDSSHPEFAPGLGGALVEVPRSVYGRLSWSF